MKTFKDIFTSQIFYEKAINKCYISEKTLNFIINSYNLQLIKHFIIPQIQNSIINIVQSKRDETEILIIFSKYPVCVEFNKFHAKQLLSILKTNKDLKQKINLDKYKSIRGYVPKKRLESYSIKTILEDEIKEISKANFINHATNPKIKEIFEEIRNIIKLNHKHIYRLKQQEFISKPNSYNIADKPQYSN